MGAVTVDSRAVVHTIGLAVWVIHVDHHRVLEVMCRSNSFNIFSVEFVGAVDGGLVPVSPVDPVLERGDGEWVT